MKRYKVDRHWIFAGLGLVAICIGLVLVKLLPDAKGFLQAACFICVGIGAGIFGSNIGTALNNIRLLKDPQAAKKVEIAKRDERNQAINIKAKARTYDFMLYAYAALLLAFAIMGVNLYVLLPLVVIYLLNGIIMACYMVKYNKEM